MACIFYNMPCVFSRSSFRFPETGKKLSLQVNMGNFNAEKKESKSSAANTYGKILKYTGLFGGVQVLQVLISVVRNKCAALFIGRVGMGITDVLNRTTDMFSALTNLGIPLSGVRTISAQQASENRAKVLASIATIRLWCLMTGLVGMILCAALSEVVNKYFFSATLPQGFIALVSPVIFMMAVYGGEAAILKGTRNLKRLASVSVTGSAISLCATIILYISFGIDGIPWALLAGTFALLVSALHATTKLFPWNKNMFSASHLRAGKALLALGVSYVAAGFAGTGAEMAVRAFIAGTKGSLGDVGIYAAGFVLCVTYTRLVFVAMDADFFPRLSAVADNRTERNAIVSKQIDVCVLMMAPMLVAFIMFLPLAVKILYSGEFKGAVGMCLGAVGYLFIKAVIAPIEYIPLAKGDSLTFFVMEVAYDVIFVVLVIFGYNRLGLEGAGMALTASYMLDLAMVYAVYRKIYGYAFSANTLKIIIVQFCTIAIALATFISGYGFIQYILGTILFALSLLFSIRKLNLTWNQIKQTFARRMQRK